MEASQDVDIFIFLFVGTLVMLILAGTIITFFMLYQKRMLRKQAELHDIELRYKEELLHSNIQMLEEERKRIAKDLHDDIGNVFSTLSWKLQQLNAGGVSEKDGKILADAKQLVTTGIGNIKTITYDMIPYGFEIFGLEASIRNLCDRIAGSGLLEINFDHSAPLPSLPEDMSLNIYRILQELTSNSIKYSGATEISILMDVSDDSLGITYKDNGKGFDMEAIRQKRGHGLKNMESRANMLKAAYRYETAPGKGVAVHIQIPLKRVP